MSACGKTRINPIHTVEVRASLVGQQWLDGLHENAVAYVGFGKTAVGTRFPVAEVADCRCRFGDPLCLAEQVSIRCRSMFGTFNLFRQEVKQWP